MGDLGSSLSLRVSGFEPTSLFPGKRSKDQTMGWPKMRALSLSPVEAGYSGAKNTTFMVLERKQ